MSVPPSKMPRATFTRSVAAIAVCLVLGGASPAAALDNGLARTPPMGWNSWNRFGCNVNETLVRGMADAMVSSGMAAAGYQYVVIDDCWQVSRDAAGTIVADASRFPSGMKALADYVHSRGLKFGLYTDAGTATCSNKPGSLDHEVQDAQTYAAWGVDFVKVDWCNTGGLDPATQYATFRDALAGAGRPILFSICNWGIDSPWSWGPATGNMWRTTGDIQDSWSSILTIIDQNGSHASAARPGAWNDPDMLEIGNGGMTATEYRSHMSLWAIMAAPLIAGNDLRDMTPETLSILTAPEVIAIDQDPLGVQGARVSDRGGLQVWAKRLEEDGAVAVALFNRTGSTADITATWSAIGLPAGSATVRDLWERADRGSFTDSYTASVPSHGTVLVKIVAGAGSGAGTLTVNRTGTGTGTVASTPAGIACGTACSATYASGTAVTLTAAPAAGSTFTGWSGACVGSGACIVTMTAANQTVTAGFAGTPQPPGPVSVNAGGGATGSFVADTYFAGGSTYSRTTAIDASQLTGTVPPQAVLQSERYGEFTYTIPGLTAGTGYAVTLYFAEVYWTAAGQRTFDVAINGNAVLSGFDIFAAAGGAGKAIARTFDAVANANGQVVIQFTRSGGQNNPKVCGIAVGPAGQSTQYALSVTKAGAGSGRVTGGGIDCGAACSASFDSGTAVTLTATAANGSTFGGWSGACTGTGTCTVTLTAARTVTATFTAVPDGDGCKTPVATGQSGNFDTTGAVCFTVSPVIHGWGCSNVDGRSVTVNGTGVTCGQLPLPGSAPYTFRFTAGTYPWASFYWW